jgi:hypothetical protein
MPDDRGLECGVAQSKHTCILTLINITFIVSALHNRYEVWQATGSVRSIKQHLPNLLRYIVVLQTMVKTTGLARMYSKYGDWYPPTIYGTVLEVLRLTLLNGHLG